MVYENQQLHNKNIEQNFVSERVILIQCFSLIITIFFGIMIFLSDFDLKIIMISFLISGPVYSINLPYLIKMIDNVEKHIISETKHLESKLRYYQQRVDKLPIYLGSNVTSLSYLISDERIDSERSKVSKEALIITFFTPAWPLAFYYLHYLLSKKIQKHAIISNKIYQLFDEMDSGLINYPGKRPSLENNVPIQNLRVYTIIAIISVIGYGMFFFQFGVGFFGIFWTFILISNINNHLNMHEENFETYSKKTTPIFTRSYNSTEKQLLPSISLLLLSFFCFGATSGFIAAFTNSIYAGISVPLVLVDENLFIIFLVSIIAPVVEEGAKVSALFLYKDNLTKIPIFYWVLFGMMAGLGFALLEDYAYFQGFYLEFSTEESLNLLLMRLLFPVHLLASASAGLGVGLWHKTSNIKYLAIFMFIAMFIHGSFNFIVTVGVN